MAILNTISLVGLILAGLALLAIVLLNVKRHNPDHRIIGRIPQLGAGGVAALLVSGIVLASVDGILFYAEPGMSYLVQYPWGAQKAVLTPGFHTRWGGEKIDFKKYLTVGFGQRDVADFSGSAPAQEIRFNDSVTADVQMTARFALPETPESFLAMALAYRSQTNLVHSSLIPVMQEAMRNAGRMFSAQEYIGGRGGDFEYAILDQIQHGIYLLDVEEERSYGGEQSVTSPENRSIQRDQTVRVLVKKRIKDGQVARKDQDSHPLERFGIQLSQANIQDVDPDPKFKEKLQEQREAAAQVAIERQRARQEEERKKRIIAQGEAEKAAKQIELEKAQIERVIAAETKAKEAEQEQQERVTRAETAKREAEIENERKQIELKTAKLEAQRLIELASADAKGRQLKMQADNALEQRLAAYVEVSQAYANAIRDKQLVPQIVIGGEKGASQSSAMDLVNLITSGVAMDLGVKVNERSGTKAK